MGDCHGNNIQETGEMGVEVVVSGRIRNGFLRRIQRVLRQQSRKPEGEPRPWLPGQTRQDSQIKREYHGFCKFLQAHGRETQCWRDSNLLKILCPSDIFPRNYSAISKCTARGYYCRQTWAETDICVCAHVCACARQSVEFLNYQLGAQYSISVTTGWTEV